MEVVELAAKKYHENHLQEENDETHLFGLDEAIKQRKSLEVLPRSQTHGVKIHLATKKIRVRIDRNGSKATTAVRHPVENLLAGSLAVQLARLRVGIHHLIEELPDDLLKRLVILFPPPPQQVPFPDDDERPKNHQKNKK